jgi:hypothetical protein
MDRNVYSDFVVSNSDLSQSAVWNDGIDDVNEEDSFLKNAVNAVDDRDICDPLHSVVVCRPLNASEALCAPSNWAGDAIRAALNTTQTALDTLIDSLELRLQQQQQRTASPSSTQTRADFGFDRRQKSALPVPKPTKPSEARRKSVSGDSAGARHSSSRHGGATATAATSTHELVRDSINAEVASVLDIVEVIVTLTSGALLVLSAVLIVGATNASFQAEVRRLSECQSDDNRVDSCLSRCQPTHDSTVARYRSAIDHSLPHSSSADRVRFSDETRSCIPPDGAAKTQTRVLLSSKHSAVCERYRPHAGRWNSRLTTAKTTDCLFVIVLHAIFAAVCYSFDLSFVWVLQLVRRHSASTSSAIPLFPRSLSQQPSVNFSAVVAQSSADWRPVGDVNAVSVLDDLLTGIHADQWLGFTRSASASGSGRRSTYVCTVDPRSPDLVGFAVVMVIHVFLAVTVFTRPAMSRWKARIVEFFYPEKRLGSRKKALPLHPVVAPPPPPPPPPASAGITQLSAGRTTRESCGSDIDERYGCTSLTEQTSASDGAFSNGLLTSAKSSPASVSRPAAAAAAFDTLQSFGRRSSTNQAVRVPPRCVACGQTVSRRRKRFKKNSSKEDAKNAASSSDPSDGMDAVNDASNEDDNTDVCPVCDCRLSPQPEPTWRPADDAASPADAVDVVRAPEDYYRLVLVGDS